MELELGSQEPAAAGPNSGYRGKSWHRRCVLPIQRLRESLCGWWTGIRYLSCAGNELCPLHPSVRPLSTEAVFAVGETPQNSPDVSGRCFFNPSRCSDGGKGTVPVSAMQPGQRDVSSSLLQLFSSAQGCRDKNLWRFQSQALLSGTMAPTQPCMLCRNEAKLTGLCPAPRNPGPSYFMVKLVSQQTSAGVQ